MIVPPVSPTVSPETFDRGKWSMHMVELNEQNTQNTACFSDLKREYAWREQEAGFTHTYP